MFLTIRTFSKRDSPHCPFVRPSVCIPSFQVCSIFIKLFSQHGTESIIVFLTTPELILLTLFDFIRLRSHQLVNRTLGPTRRQFLNIRKCQVAYSEEDCNQTLLWLTEIIETITINFFCNKLKISSFFTFCIIAIQFCHICHYYLGIKLYLITNTSNRNPVLRPNAQFGVSLRGLKQSINLNLMVCQMCDPILQTLYLNG